MTPEQLRISIIKYVLSGKLTQSKDEEDTKSIDNEYFEIYQVPASWDIVSLEDCCYIHARIGWQALRKDEHQKSGDYLLVTGTDFKNGLVNYSTCVYISKERYDMDEKIQLQNDDILVTKDGSIGKVAVVKNLPMPATLNAGVFVIRPDDRFDKRYIEYLFQCSYFTYFVNLVKSGTTIKHLNQNKLQKFKIPVPMIDEQKEIVRVLDELLPYVDRFDILDKKVKQLNAKFPEDMKKSILQYAIQGKLVEQRPEEGTAEELFQQIQGEKQKLIKEGKIKKEKSSVEITEDEIPFDIPESWKWVYLKDIISVYGGKRIPAGKKLTKENTGHIYIRVSDMKNGSVSKEDIHFVPEDVYPLIKNYTISKEDVYITVAGTIGRVGIIPEEFDNANLTENADKLVIYSLNKQYIMYLMDSPIIQKQITDVVTKVGQPKLAIKRIEDLLIPLPPLEEQQRIVKKIEELLPYCERLTNKGKNS